MHITHNFQAKYKITGHRKKQLCDSHLRGKTIQRRPTLLDQVAEAAKVSNLAGTQQGRCAPDGHTGNLRAKIETIKKKPKRK